MGAELGFEVIGLGLVAPRGRPGHEPYSSTRIRELLAEGDVAGAAELLGRPHEVRGTVVRGRPRGRELGFPTANVAVPERDLPARRRHLRGHVPRRRRGRAARPRSRSAAARRSTSDAEHSLLEAYVLDFDGDLYGQPVAVRFVERLRGEQRFDSVDALVEQMARDVEATRRLLSSA